jgi:signal transduction histidine kinase/HAMP domain-containing protein
LSRQSEVERVMLVDHRGRVRLTSDPDYEGRILDRDHETTCRVCHVDGSAPATTRTAVTEHTRRRVFRSMNAIPNEPQCHGCHDAEIATNGILLMDLALGPGDRRFFADISGTLALGAIMVLLTIAVLGWLLDRMVHKPLQAVMASSQRVTQGDLDARASVPTPGEFSRLATYVNRMTDHLSASIRTVEAQRRRAQDILDAVDDEILVLDREFCVVAANLAFRQRLEDADRDITGQPCRQLGGPRGFCAAGESGSCPIERVFATGLLSKGIASSTESDGRERVIEIHASPLRGPDGTVQLAVEVRRDISERRQMEAIVAHSEHLASLGLLASGLSHEINNPLGAIATSVEGLRRRLRAGPSILAEAAAGLDTMLQRIAHEVERCRAITHRLLRVARPPGSVRSLVDVNHVVEDIVSVLSHDIKRSGIRTRLELKDRLPPLPGDESRLSQVIMNITLNAIQAMAREGGELRIGTDVEDGMIRIEVDDTGCGIPTALLKRIYEPFFTTKPEGKGTGLGLFITHQIVADLGGTIEMRSEAGRGTSFKVLLPLAPATT